MDNEHMLVSIMPKYAGPEVVGLIKGKSAIQLARVYEGKKTLYDSISAPAGSSCLQSGEKRRSSGSAIETKKTWPARLEQMKLWT